MDLEARIRQVLVAEDALQPNPTYAYEAVATRGRRRRIAMHMSQLVAVATVIAVVAAGTAFVFGGSTRLEPAPPSDNPIPSLTEPATSTTSPAAAASATTLPSSDPTNPYLCDDTMPFVAIGPDDFTGPINGPSPDASTPAEEGQLVIHWQGQDGSIELRWPPNTEYTTDVEIRGPLHSQYTTAVTWGEPTRSGEQSPTQFLGAFPTINGDDGTPLPLVFDAYNHLPAINMDGPCDAVQLDSYVSTPRPGEAPAKGGAQASGLPASDNSTELTVLLDWRRPAIRELVLIVDSLAIDTLPPVLDCDTDLPDRTRTVVDGPSFTTPTQALEALLETNEAYLWPRTGYYELVEPDGSITYGRPLDNGTPEGPRPEAGLAIAVSVEQTSQGWTVTKWSWTLSEC